MVLLGIKGRRLPAIRAPVASVDEEVSEELCRYLEGLGELAQRRMGVRCMDLRLPKPCSLYTASLPAHILAAAAPSWLVELSINCMGLAQLGGLPDDIRGPWANMVRHLVHTLRGATSLQHLKLAMPVARNLAVRLDRMPALQSLDVKLVPAGKVYCDPQTFPTISLGACQLTALRFSNSYARLCLSHPQPTLHSLVLAGAMHVTFQGVEHLGAVTALLLERPDMLRYLGFKDDVDPDGCISLPGLEVVRAKQEGVKIDPRVKKEFERRGVVVEGFKVAAFGRLY